MRILVTILALLIACSPIDGNVPSPSPPLLPDLSVVDMAGSPSQDLAVVTGPTRIVQRTWTGSDGVVVKLPFDLYDTVEKIPCSIKLATDGVVRCLPVPTTTYFQDAACTVRVMHVILGCVPEKYYLGYIVNTCGGVGTYAGYRTGSKVSISKLYYLSGSACVDTSASIPIFDFYSLVAVPPSTFAAGTLNY